MGVKPFYYAYFPSGVIFSNTLDCIRKHSAVSDTPNDLAIADFVLFGLNQDSATTSFAEIQRLPAAYRAVWSRSGLQLSRYWSMPIDEPIFYRRPDDYIDRFRELLRRAVDDRLSAHRVSIFLSGGLDSATLAATTRDLMNDNYSNSRLDSFTVVDALVPDEQHYARMTAESLRIPIACIPGSDSSDFAWEHVPFSLPEPYPDAYLIHRQRQFWKRRDRLARVFFYGEGPDNALTLDWRPYLDYLRKKGRYGMLFRNVISTVLATRRPPFWGRISNWVNRRTRVTEDARPDFPTWLNANFESRLQLRARWREVNSAAAFVHPIRPKSYASLQNPLWQYLFERFDAGATEASFEVRHPFVDIRMLRFLLAVPPLPWCRSKYLLRRAMRGSLPTQVLRRKKAALDALSLRKFLANFCQSPFTPAEGIGEYIDPERLPTGPSLEETEDILRVRVLNHWLQNSHRHSHNSEEGSFCEQSARQAAPSA